MIQTASVGGLGISYIQKTSQKPCFVDLPVIPPQPPCQYAMLDGTVPQTWCDGATKTHPLARPRTGLQEQPWVRDAARLPNDELWAV